MASKRVLIVDDEPDIVESIQFRLELEDLECIVACDGEQALVKAKREKPDIILLDIMLPKISGYKVARLLKFDMSYKNIPIIMLTAKGSIDDRELGNKVGTNEYVAKPFDMETLVSLVKHHLNM